MSFVPPGGKETYHLRHRYAHQRHDGDNDCLRVSVGIEDEIIAVQVEFAIPFLYTRLVVEPIPGIIVVGVTVSLYFLVVHRLLPLITLPWGNQVVQTRAARDLNTTINIIFGGWSYVLFSATRQARCH